jgi:hypothetical protein
MAAMNNRTLWWEIQTANKASNSSKNIKNLRHLFWEKKTTLEMSEAKRVLEETTHKMSKSQGKREEVAKQEK